MRKLWIILLIINMLPGCGQSDIKRFIKNTDKTKGIVEPLPTSVKVKHYQYTASNSPSPFGENNHPIPDDFESVDSVIVGDISIGAPAKTNPVQEKVKPKVKIETPQSPIILEPKPKPLNFIEVKKDDVIILQPNPEHGRKKMYLEQFELANLKYVGNMVIRDYSWALILDPKGELHHIQVGDYLGRKDGKVIAILDQKLTIRELTLNKKGSWDQTNIDLALTLKTKNNPDEQDNGGDT